MFLGLDEFQIKSICSEISANNTFGPIRKTTRDEIVEDFKSVGYNTIIFDDEEKIAECAKYYAKGERICTYNNLPGRMKDYHMIVAIKKDIDKIQRSSIPKREDEYGTSILNIQIAKDGSHMSIKNRYNHTVRECDSTLNNDLNLLVPGLQEKVLGYYKITCLNWNKAYYPFIVNINGIYLKYKIERGNVYLGDFLLDRVNGVRCQDHSRWYVNCCPDNLCVLDFHNKEVVSPFKQCRQPSKATLLTRAMKENLLNSGNKECVDDLNIVFPDALKELLQCRKKALKYLAHYYNYDFQKPFKVTGLLGKFTSNSIKKITGSSDGTLLICKGEEVFCVVLDCGIFNGRLGMSSREYGIDNYRSKGNFETDRKSGKLGVFIIQQDSKYKREKKETPTKSYGYWDEFDKSGYNVSEARRQLRNRLERFKKNKLKKEVDAINYDPELKEIKEMFREIKEKLVFELSRAKASNDYRILSYVIDYKITWIVLDIEKLERKVTQKDFSSIKEATNMIKKIKEDIMDTAEEIESKYHESEM